jgi:hypothetical protein
MPGTPAVSAARQVMISTRVVLSDVAFAPTRVRYPFLRKVSEDSLSIKRGPLHVSPLIRYHPSGGVGGYPPTPPFFIVRPGSSDQDEVLIKRVFFFFGKSFFYDALF